MRSGRVVLAGLVVAALGCTDRTAPAVRLNDIEYPSTGQEKGTAERSVESHPPRKNPAASRDRTEGELREAGVGDGASRVSRQPAPTRAPPTIAQPIIVRGLFDNFCRQVARSCADRGSIGCLPLVTYDFKRQGPWVSELGVRLAGDVASGIVDAGYRGQSMPPSAVEVRLTEMNVDKKALSTLAAVSEQGDRLGCDVVVFGTIKHTIDTGQSGHEVLKISISAFDLMTRRSVAEDEIEVSSDRENNRPIFDLAQRDSLWQPGERWVVPDVPRTFEKEIEAVSTLLARRIGSIMSARKVEGAVYLPPADTSEYVQAVAKLRAAQGVFAEEFERRSAQAKGGDEALRVERPVTMNGLEFRTLDGARDYLANLGESVKSSPAYRFARSIPEMLVEKLRPEYGKLGAVSIGDPHTGAWYAQQAIEGELTGGGLARAPRTREMLQASGNANAIVTRFEQFGSSFILRAELYDTRSGDLVASTHVPIQSRFEGDLARQLGIGERLAPVADAGTPPGR